MYGRKKLQKENEANFIKTDSDTTKKFEDEPAERKRLTALQTWEMEDFIFDLQSKEEVRRGGGGKKGEITASPRAVSEALACAYVGLLG